MRNVACVVVIGGHNHSSTKLQISRTVQKVNIADSFVLMIFTLEREYLRLAHCDVPSDEVGSRKRSSTKNRVKQAIYGTECDIRRNMAMTLNNCTTYLMHIWVRVIVKSGLIHQ